jgi:prenyltransferase/squalene oxidase-like repeat protein
VHQKTSIPNTLTSRFLAIEKARNFLRSQRNPDAGWAYFPGNSSAAEPTCYAAMALGANGSETMTTAWIARHAEAQEPVWTRSLSLLALRRLRAREDMQAKLVQLFLAESGKQLPKTNEINGQLRGWSWMEGTFSWVEPTSYALIALKSSGVNTHTRIREAEQLLLDRACTDGGWNYGNRLVRGVALSAMTSTTALAVMALQGTAGVEPVVRRALDLLTVEVPRTPSALSLALTILCFDVYGRQLHLMEELLISRQQADGSWRGQAHLTSLAILALTAKEQTNAFAI